MLRAFRVPIGWMDLFKRTANELMADNCLNLAAALSYYFFLALFPALLFLVALAVFIVISFVLVVAGPTMAEKIATYAHMGDAFKWTWWIVQWPIVFLLVSLAMAMVYYFAPDAEQEWIWIGSRRDRCSPRSCGS